jgi:RecA/RadA recombinase
MNAYFPEYDKFNFLLYNPRTFRNLIKIIMNLEFLILKEIEILGKTNIGLIVLDTVSTLRQLELGNQEQNQKTQLALNSAIATLAQINFKYNIPVIMTNRAIITYGDSSEEANEKPANATLLKYWSNYCLKIERTSKAGVRIITLQNHPKGKSKVIKAELTPKGFV